MGELIQQIASLVNNWIVVIAFFVLQYNLVRRPQRWLSFVLPAVYVILAILNVVQVVQAGEVILGGLFSTALFTFFVGMITPVLLLIIYFRRKDSLATTLITVFFVYLAVELIIALVVTIASVQMLQNDAEINPPPNVVIEEPLQE